jgi:heme/copper-type cytochrome/quinol oxidase subunit 4
MKGDAMTDEHVETYAQDLKSYCIGGLLALMLTALAFGLVIFEILPRYWRWRRSLCIFAISSTLVGTLTATIFSSSSLPASSCF